MNNDKAEIKATTEVAATPDKPIVKQSAQSPAAPNATPTVRPWTSKFVLPSIRFRASKRG